ncbi:NAD(P)H-dependent oxidoreductase [Sphingomonas canadensis]|uniref:NAD(P)H-dependent oxidoreductase n=1 Tax=Sphingomonas canadensis TaxID=1219257 RepID=A0ABW3HBY9_9SPHN|nr:NAD(P)H-dependent oxidoreductase [Sphingomonas canadensis]MCW3837886.1 NAD(P)H-dependent oxidoreductase [Sphingomonas canadensis]
MPRKIALIDAHPDPDPARFVHALAVAYAEGAEAGGHAVRRIDLARLDFPLLRSPADWKTGTPVADIIAAQEVIAWADHIVILYPLWLGDMPALLKGFLEQVARPGYAIAADAAMKPVLKGKSARVVVTMGMPGLVYRIWFRAHSLLSLKRNILEFVGIRPVRTTVFGLVEGSSAETRAGWVARMRAMGRRGE